MNTTTFAAQPPAGAEGRDRTAGLKVLVAEDNADGADLLGRILEGVGHSARVLYDGQDALTSALIDPPDVAILDIGLPRLDGWEVARALRRALAGRPCLIVAVTGHDDDPDRDRSRGAGINLHLRKPADPELLTELLGRYARAKASP
jgi:CheY-like chemotaxis protein